MTVSRALRAAFVLAALAAGALLRQAPTLTAASSLPSPEQFIGFRVGTDNKLARWDKIVDYMKLAGSSSDRVRYRELGKTSGGTPMIALEIASADTLKNLDRYKQLERRLYFQNGAPSARERDEIFRQGKAVVLITCATHANEIGSTQMALELVHQLATDDSPTTRKILDNVIILLVPSLNPDGQTMITDWFNRNVGTPYESSPFPLLYHRYVGHDSNRDMYMFTQKESQYAAQLAWHDWFPTVWLDAHQMNANGPRMFVMPATDPINPNVHPAIYRWATIFGQSQAAALESAGKDGIIHNSIYTNFWEGAMAWSGWWHNQIGLLTEVASVRIAGPVDQQRATRPDVGASEGPNHDSSDPTFTTTRLPPPTDTTPRSEYPRPWMGGKWTLRDIVDYELIATMALLETAADRRETILRHIYEVNRTTIEDGRSGALKAIVIPADQHDPREAGHLAERLMMGGVEVYRADAPFSTDDDSFAAGSYVVPMTQVFARYAKDLLERQMYPEVRRSNEAAPDPPYDVTAWSLGMLFGVDVKFVTTSVAHVRMTKVAAITRAPGRIVGTGPQYVFEYLGPDTAIAMNRLIKGGARLSFQSGSQVVADDVSRDAVDAVAKEFGLTVVATAATGARDPGVAGSSPSAGVAAVAEPRRPIRMPRIGLYYPWTGGNIDEGWTRWVLEQYEFPYTTIHNKDVRDGNLRQRFETIIFADQFPREIIDGYLANTVRAEYRGGIGDVGLDQISRFVAEGGTLVTLGAASDLAIDRFPIPVRNLKRALRRDQHFAPGTILRIQVDTTQPMGFGMAASSYGFYNNSPFFSTLEGFHSLKPTVIARYPNQDVVASGWLRGEELMAGRAAVVSFDMKPAGRVVLFGLRPQHRAQTHATFPLLFNSLYLPAHGEDRPTE
ncbi:MAG: M14 metallopeptidase family protein [Vicinamibacterales bacterium]